MKIKWHTEIAGNPAKPPVVFLHGFLGRGEDWKTTVKSLAKSHHCLCPDLPGHGKTTVADGPPEGYTMDKVANGLLAHLDACGIDRAGLVGYSMGGRLALRLALECPERFPVAVIESASPGLKTEAEQDTRREHDFALAHQLEAMAKESTAFREFLDTWYAQPIFVSLQAHEGLVARLVDDRFSHNRPETLAAALRGMSVGVQESLWKRLTQYRTPTLFVTGEEDRKYRQLGEEMSAASEAIALEVMADCGHNVHLENPEGYTTLIEHFLGRLQ